LNFSFRAAYSRVLSAGDFLVTLFSALNSGGRSVIENVALEKSVLYYFWFCTAWWPGFVYLCALKVLQYCQYRCISQCMRDDASFSATFQIVGLLTCAKADCRATRPCCYWWVPFSFKTT